MLLGHSTKTLTPMCSVRDDRVVLLADASASPDMDSVWRLALTRVWQILILKRPEQVPDCYPLLRVHRGYGALPKTEVV